MSLLETMTIGQKSVTVHGQRIKVHAKNIANAAKAGSQCEPAFAFPSHARGWALS